MQRRSRIKSSGQRVGLWSLVLSALCLLTAFVWAACQGGPETSAATAPQEQGQEQKSASEAKENAGKRQVVVTYFHTAYRCPTCTLLEEYSKEAVEKRFAKEMQEGKIVFRHVNVQEPENEHFIKDYSLFSKSLVVSEVRDGKEARWKNLSDIWRLVRDRDRYEQYVAGEIEEYLKDL